MAKIVVLVLSGPSDKRKVMTGLMFAKMAEESGELEDVKLIISAQAVEIFKEPDFRDVLENVKAALTPTVCKMNAEGAGVAGEVESQGVPLAAVGKELIGLLNDGYKVLTF
ncbi:MAG: DsrE family protein [Nitrospirota bacterium]|jgi:hypothetical protein